MKHLIGQVEFKAQVIFHSENNGYAISVPIDEQTSGGSVYKISSGYENLHRIKIDGTDYFESLIALNSACDRARKGLGPTLIESMVVRLLPHSSSDDHRKYRLEKDINSDKNNDPLEKFKQVCIKNNILSKNDFLKLEKNISDEIDEDALWAEKQNDPEDSTLNLFVKEKKFDSNIVLKENDIVLVDAINHAMDEELEFNDKMLIFGQDVAGGKGGVFTATKGLTDKKVW